MSSSDSTQPDLSAAAEDDGNQPGFGWTVYAERINGRFAMVGFLALLILEIFTRQDFFTWLGLP
ncbi:chlorophyll a/b-binding protein [Leptothoe kymatousa]|uniref:High light inducible protein n=1 Tax=Leptothoe kymatousa TAU-MAC 1615 TaxID=2364775 RepID=A0ABS5Y5I3_9CYAN|nr:chlorophyll a/b-binding protein [Leptothoe kymatousa]MBT9313061.1 high light inducible protein [Leptothoe kymatousa TAU-MAC 1615]